MMVPVVVSFPRTMYAYAVSAALTAAMLMALPSAAIAVEQAYPTRPIRILIPFPAGGSTDLLARMVGQRLTDAWGQPAVPDNRVGANAILASEIAAKAAADGHTLLMIAIGHAANVSLYRKLPYDTLNDFTPLIAVADVPIFLAVHPQVKAATVKELVALAKARPGGINCASGGVGASHHLAGELFRQMTGTDFQHIQYKGGGPALIELVGGRVDMMFTPVSTAIQYVKGGRLRALAVTSPQRVALMPELPTIAEAGVPGYESRAWYGLVGPGRMDNSLATRINHELDRMLKSAEGRDKLQALGVIPMGGSAAEFGTFIRREIEKYARVVKTGGIRVE
jgi:tripartite-type tricarboxylate transporter receptor subunit TctC